MMAQLTVKGSVFIEKKCKNDTLTTMEWRYLVWLQKLRIFYSKMEAVMVYQSKVPKIGYVLINEFWLGYLDKTQRWG